MIVTELHLANVRGLEKAPFSFQPGMNLLVGVNGAGKSTALDALRVLLSRVVQGLSSAKVAPEGFERSDRMDGRDFLSARLVGEIGETPFAYLIHRTFEETAADTSQTGQVRGQTHDTPDRAEWVAAEPGAPSDRVAVRRAAKAWGGVPLAVYFGPARSVIERERGDSGAYSRALRSRPLRLREFAEWWRRTEVLISEYEAEERTEEAQRRRLLLDSLEVGVGAFLAGRYRNLRAVGTDATLVLDRGEMTLDISQLSDGERGVLALVLDLTRRLALANPTLDDPAREGQAVVLIDEIDLHLHPGWQREIVSRLQQAFPRCQFICTTHSPHAISEVHPNGVQYLVRDGDNVGVVKRPQSYGLDANWILEFLMDTPPEPEVTKELHEQIEAALDEDDFATARRLLDELKEKVGGDSGRIARLEGSLFALEALADEDDPEE